MSVNYAKVNLATSMNYRSEAPSPSFNSLQGHDQTDSFAEPSIQTGSATTTKQFKRLTSPQILAEMNIEK